MRNSPTLEFIPVDLFGSSEQGGVVGLNLPSGSVWRQYQLLEFKGQPLTVQPALLTDTSTFCFYLF